MACRQTIIAANEQRISECMETIRNICRDKFQTFPWRAWSLVYSCVIRWHLSWLTGQIWRHYLGPELDAVGMLSGAETARMYDAVIIIRSTALQTHSVALDHLNEGLSVVHNPFGVTRLPDQDTLFLDMNMCVMHTVDHDLYQQDKYLRD